MEGVCRGWGFNYFRCRCYIMGYECCTQRDACCRMPLKRLEHECDHGGVHHCLLDLYNLCAMAVIMCATLSLRFWHLCTAPCLIQPLLPLQ
jgi:hypothetical protein